MYVDKNTKDEFPNVVQNWKFMSFRVHRLHEQARPNIEIYPEHSHLSRYLSHVTTAIVFGRLSPKRNRLFTSWAVSLCRGYVIPCSSGHHEKRQRCVSLPLECKRRLTTEYSEVRRLVFMEYSV